MKPKAAMGEQPVKNVYQRVTDQILAELAKGTAPWRKPWQVDFGLPRNLISRRAYKGSNILTLMSAALAASYEANWWCTYRQALELGGHVNKGEHGYPILFYQGVPVAETEQPEAVGKSPPNDAPHWRPVLKVFTVFNATNQCSDLSIPETPRHMWDPVGTAELIAEATGIPLHYEGIRAFYSPTTDSITLPPRPSFTSAEGFYSTLLHELVHATGHASRLGRTFGEHGTEAYAWEELIAEMGSAMLSVITGVPAPDFPNIANYLDSWRKRMQRDTQAVAEAAAAAQKAVEWLLTAASLPLPE